ncbi:MAG: hypothetical protein QXO40_05535 [Candidatus Aenigmatarchaeota archaeon]
MKILDTDLKNIESNIEIPLMIKISDLNCFTYYKETEQIKQISKKLIDSGFIKILPYTICCKIKLLYPFLERFPNGLIIFVQSENLNLLEKLEIIKSKTEPESKKKKKKLIIESEIKEEQQ